MPGTNFIVITLMDHTPVEDKAHTIPKEEFDNSQEDTNLRTIQSQSPFESVFSLVKNYRSKSSCVDIQLMRMSGNLKLKKSKGYIYYGEMVGGRLHGLGIIIFDDKRVFQGSWRANRKHGKGYQQFPSGNRFEGQYVNGKPEGEGKYFWVNGQMYQGSWFNGLRNGAGTWRGINNDSYLGQWRDGKPQGLGVHIWANGDRYEGYFKESLKHGQGSQRYSSGDLYRGHFQKGQKHGYGQYYWIQGGSYKGYFREGIRHGKGYWQSSTGDSYNGEYKEGKKHGVGIYTWSNGIVYNGHFQQDLRHGYGQIFWTDGSYYKGNWIKGEQSPEGELFFQNQEYKTRKNNKRLLKTHKIENDQYLETNIKLETNTRSHPDAFYPHKQKRYNDLRTKDIKRSREAENGNIKLRLRTNTLQYHEKCKTQSESRQKWKTGVLVQRKRSKTLANERQVQNLKLCVSHLKKNTVDFTSKVVSPINQFKPNYRKEHIPHSAYYVHQIHKRFKTANDDYLPFTNPVQSLQSVASNKEGKSYNLTRLMHKSKIARYRSQNN